MHVDGGYLQDEGLHRALQAAVDSRAPRAQPPTTARRSRQALAALVAIRPAPTAPRSRSVRAAWQKLQQELDTSVGLGGTKVPRRADPVGAGSTPPRSTTSSIAIAPTISSSIDWGKAAEGIGVAAHRRRRARDPAARRSRGRRARRAGHPAAAAKTPPPPPDPKELVDTDGAKSTEPMTCVGIGHLSWG